jgi:hypothetical protein
MILENIKQFFLGSQQHWFRLGMAWSFTALFSYGITYWNHKPTPVMFPLAIVVSLSCLLFSFLSYLYKKNNQNK